MSTSWLTPKEYQLYQRAKSEKRKDSFLLGRYCAKQALKVLVGLEDPQRICIEPGVFGQPVVHDQRMSNVQVSISHHNDVGVAVAFPERHPMGIDIEVLSDQRVAVIQKQLTDNEIRLQHTVPGLSPAAFNGLIWTARESLSKILKTGLMVPHAVFEIHGVDPSDQGYRVTFKNFFQYQALVTVEDSVVVSLCLPKNSTLSDRICFSQLSQKKSDRYPNASPND